MLYPMKGTMRRVFWAVSVIAALGAVDGAARMRTEGKEQAAAEKSFPFPLYSTNHVSGLFSGSMTMYHPPNAPITRPSQSLRISFGGPIRCQRSR